jgi:uncharacterized membrane protein
MARSPSIHVYTHRRDFLHFCRMRERDLNLFVFARYAGPEVLPGAGKSGPRAQKWPARSETTYTRIARLFSICAVIANWIWILLFLLDIAPWVPPGAGQKRAAGPKMARSPSTHVYTHRRDFLHFCRMRELDLIFFGFARYAGPEVLPGAGKSGPRAQKWPARSETTYTRIARLFSICAVIANWIWIILFLLDIAPWVPPGAGQKRSAGPKMVRSP